MKHDFINLLPNKKLKAELEKSHSAREGEFRKWLVKIKPKNSVLLPIETSTAIGVSDLYYCYMGQQGWAECKVVMGRQRPTFRGAQYLFFRQLAKAGGSARLIVQRLHSKTDKPGSIQIYDGIKLGMMPSSVFGISGKNLTIPDTVEPYYEWLYSNVDKIPPEEMVRNLMLDL